MFDKCEVFCENMVFKPTVTLDKNCMPTFWSIFRRNTYHAATNDCILIPEELIKPCFAAWENKLVIMQLN